jgi:hypothetical protein
MKGFDQVALQSGWTPARCAVCLAGGRCEGREEAWALVGLLCDLYSGLARCISRILRSLPDTRVYGILSNPLHSPTMTRWGARRPVSPEIELDLVRVPLWISTMNYV